jgi:hypothetical protein
MRVAAGLASDKREALRSGAVLVSACLLVFAAAVHRLPAVPLLITLIGGLVMLVAARRLLQATAVGIALVVLTPVYYARLAPGVDVGMTPAVVVALLLLPGALALRDRLRLQLEDWVFLLFWTLYVSAYLLNYDNQKGNFLNLSLNILLPYTLFRLVLMHPLALATVSRVVVLCGVPLSVIAIRERQGIPNPYFTLIHPQFQTVWARPDLRGTAIRSEAAFGHPIALGMFLGLAILLALALGHSSSRASTRLVYVAAAVLMSIALVDTLSRGPMATVALAVALWFASQVPSLTFAHLRRIGVALAAAALVATVTAGTVSQLREFSRTDRAVINSTQHRLEILAVVTSPQQFSVLGKPVAGADATAAGVAASVGLISIDDQFAKLFLEGGLLTFAAFLMLALLAWREVFARRRSALERAWAISMGTAFLNLFTVALLTQYTQVFWMGIAALAVIRQRHKAFSLTEHPAEHALEPAAS